VVESHLRFAWCGSKRDFAETPLSYSFYDAFVTPVSHILGSYSGFLAKAEEFAQEKGMDPAAFLTAKLADDMFDLTRQVQIASDTAKGGAARLSGAEVPKWEDTEKTFGDLRERLLKTIAYVRSIDPAAFAGAEDRAIVLPGRNGDRHFHGASYLNTFVLPNVYFHTATGYGILRSQGVPVGKADFLKGE
jgi:hypothetical protein